MVEAAMVLPLTILIMLAVISWMITCFTAFTELVDEHNEELGTLYEQREVIQIRMKDGMEQMSDEVVER